MSGIVYLLTNPAMPGLVKIGKTTTGDPQGRMDQLYTSGVPVPFECELAMRVEDPGLVERALHTAFGPNRVNPRREFFEINPEQAAVVLRIIGSEDLTPNVSSENDTISESERAATIALRRRRPNLNFTQMGIPQGAVLQCASKDDETVTVVDDRKVSYQDQEMSLTEATRKCLEISYNIAPAGQWLYEGRNLREIYDATYPFDGG